VVSTEASHQAPTLSLTKGGKKALQHPVLLTTLVLCVLFSAFVIIVFKYSSSDITVTTVTQKTIKNSAQNLSNGASEFSVSTPIDKAGKKEKETKKETKAPKEITPFKKNKKERVQNELQEKIKTEKKKPKREQQQITVIINYENEEQKEELKREIEEAGGTIHQDIITGNSFIVEALPQQAENIVNSRLAIRSFANQEFYAVLNEVHQNVHTQTAHQRNPSVTGQGIRIAMLDTGVDKHHPMLEGKVLYEKSFVGDDNASDEHGHGTADASVLAGQSERFTGIAPGAQILNAKVLDKDGKGTTASILEGIDWAVRYGADIITMSFGGPYNDPDSPIHEAIREAGENGVVVVVSAGNCGVEAQDPTCRDYMGVTTPGNSPDVITVGSVNDQRGHAPFSSGQAFETEQGIMIKPDVVVPGVEVITASLHNEYAAISGTSVSAQIVGGIAALLLEMDPDLSPQQIKTLLKQSAIDLGDPGEDLLYGAGFIDIDRIVKPTLVIAPELRLLSEHWSTAQEGPGPFTDSLLFTNTGDEILRIDSITVPDDTHYTIVDNDNNQIFPRETKEVRIQHPGIERDDQMIVQTNQEGNGGEDQGIVRIPFQIVYEGNLPVIENVEYTKYGIIDKDSMALTFTARDNNRLERVEAVLIYPSNEEKWIELGEQDRTYSGQIDAEEINAQGVYVLKITAEDNEGHAVEEQKKMRVFHDKKQTIQNTQIAGEFSYHTIWKEENDEADRYIIVFEMKSDAYPCLLYPLAQNARSCEVDQVADGLMTTYQNVPDGQGQYHRDAEITDDDLVFTCSVAVLDNVQTAKVCAELRGEKKDAFFLVKNVQTPNYLDFTAKLTVEQGNACNNEDACDIQDGWYGEFSEVCVPHERRKGLMREYKDYETDENCDCRAVYQKEAPFELLRNEVCMVEENDPNNAEEGNEINNEVSAQYALFGGDVLQTISLGSYIPANSFRPAVIWTHQAEQSRLKAYLVKGERGRWNEVPHEYVGTAGIQPPGPREIGNWMLYYFPHPLQVSRYVVDESWCNRYNRVFFLHENYYNGGWHEDIPEEPDVQEMANCGEEGQYCSSFLLSCNGGTERQCQPGYDSQRYCLDGNVARDRVYADCSKTPEVVRECEEGEYCRSGKCRRREFSEGFYGEPYCTHLDDQSVVRNYRYSNGNEEAREIQHCNGLERCGGGGCVNPYEVTASPRCSNNEQSSTTCITRAGQQLGINNAHHTGSEAVDQVPNFVCYDWWNDNSRQQGSMQLDGHSWDFCHGNCNELNNCRANVPADAPWTLEEVFPYSNREVRVLVAGYSNEARQNVYDQSVLRFTWTNYCQRQATGQRFCSQEGKGGNVFRPYIQEDCSTRNEVEEICAENQVCTDGRCLISMCATDADCGAPSFSQQTFCREGNRWADQTVYHCVNPGTARALCEGNTIPTQRFACENGCNLGQCINIVRFSSALEKSQNNRIKKQAGDKVTIAVQADRNGRIEFSYPPDNFEPENPALFDGNTADVHYGENAFVFKISEGTNNGLYSLRVKDETYIVEVITRPETIVVTNSKALRYEFPDLGQDVTVSELLQKAYGDSDEQRIVYDLADYFDEMPWGLFNNYNQQPQTPSLQNNEYVVRIADFIRDRCYFCSSIILLGDDYVIPHLRVDLEDVMSEENREVVGSTLLTDEVYIPKTKKSFAEFDSLFYKDGEYEGKDVVLILPDRMNEVLRNQINRMKEVLEEKFNPDLREVSERNVRCDDFNANLDDKLLIILGTTDNNRALRCFQQNPDLDYQDSASIERNVWSDDVEYAVLMNTEEPSVIEIFTAFIEGNEYKKLTGEHWQTIRITSNVVGGVALGVGITLVVVGTGGTAGIALVAVGAGAGVAGDVIDATDYCWVNLEDGFCPYVAAGFIIPGAVDKYGAKAFKLFMKNGGDKAIRVFDEFGTDVKVLTTRILKETEFGEQQIRLFGKLIKAADQNAEKVFQAYKKLPTDYIDNVLRKFDGSLRYFDEGVIDPTTHRFMKWKRYTNTNQVFRGVNPAQGETREQLQERVFRGGFHPQGGRDGHKDLLRHVSGDNANSAFVSASKREATAVRFGSQGYVFEINPRALNGVDVERTYLPELDLADLPQDEIESLRNLVTGEDEISFFQGIDPRDIKGAWNVVNGKVDTSDIRKFEPNPNYKE